MIGIKRILAVVPARGGSKGILLKNLRPVAGVSMIARVGAVLRELRMIDRAVVSTDHEEIARVAESVGIAAPFRRPPELSGDRIGDLEVLTHALLEMEAQDGVEYDIVIMLQPTSPLRQPKHVRDAVNMLVEGAWDAVWTVSETDSKSHPLKQLCVDDKAHGALGYYDATGGKIIARQQLRPVFHRNGIAYVMTRACLLDQKTLMGQRTAALVLQGHFVSIDTEYDIALVEWLMAQSESAAGSHL